MRVKQYKGKIFGADLTAKERLAMNIEINRQIVEADRKYTNDIDAMVLYTLHVHLGFGKKRLRRFWEAFQQEHKALVEYYQMNSFRNCLNDEYCKTEKPQKKNFGS